MKAGVFIVKCLRETCFISVFNAFLHVPVPAMSANASLAMISGDDNF